MSENKKHGHYFKPVTHLTEIDVYRVCDLFQVNDPSGATQHAIKKLLLPGGRGAGKSMEKDIQEAIDSLQRKLEMLREDFSPNEIYGIPFKVENTIRACHTMEQVSKLVLLSRAKGEAPSVIYISDLLHQELLSQYPGARNEEPNKPD